MKNYLKFKNEGYLVLDTYLDKNIIFKKYSKIIYKFIKKEINSNKYNNFGGYMMGNLNINQGYLGPKFFSLVFDSKIKNIFENITKKKLKDFDVIYGGNISLPKKGEQHFHIDGTFKQEMYLVSFATENINENNGPTEICVGTHNKMYKYYQFFFSKKKLKKIFLKKGQIIIRKHNLWHKGTKNLSNNVRVLLSFIMIPKIRKINTKLNGEFIKILPNFFNSNLRGKIHEFFYVEFSFLIKILKLINSIIRNK